MAARKPPVMSLEMDPDDIDLDASISATWSIDVNGTMCHRPTGVSISERTGITVPGSDQQYLLAAKDIEYEDGSHLGAGAGGVVMKGFIAAGTKLSPVGRIPVAIKTIKVDCREKRAQLLNEIRGLLQAQWSPNLVHWYGGFPSKSSGTVHVVLEFMDRGSLADLKKKLSRTPPGAPQVPNSPVPPDMLGCINAQVMKGLNFLHERKMLHRDVKPENILHRDNGDVKLTDFGISKELGMSLDAVAVTFMGTITYMSPERCLGEDYGTKADVWSVGMVLYDLATGKYPFDDVSSFPALFAALMDEPEPRLPEADVPSAELRDFVALCLTRDVSVRPETSVLLEHDFCTKTPASTEALSAWFQSLRVGS